MNTDCVFLAACSVSEITGQWASVRLEPVLTLKSSSLQCKQPRVVIFPSWTKESTHRHIFKCQFPHWDHAPIIIELFCWELFGVISFSHDILSISGKNKEIYQPLPGNPLLLKKKWPTETGWSYTRWEGGRRPPKTGKSWCDFALFSYNPITHFCIWQSRKVPTMEYYSVRKNEILPTENDKIPYDLTYMWNLKNKTNEQAK